MRKTTVIIVALTPFAVLGALGVAPLWVPITVVALQIALFVYNEATVPTVIRAPVRRRIAILEADIKRLNTRLGEEHVAVQQQFRPLYEDMWQRQIDESMRAQAEGRPAPPVPMQEPPAATKVCARCDAPVFLDPISGRWLSVNGVDPITAALCPNGNEHVAVEVYEPDTTP